MIITISGDAGTGTTTLAKHLSTTLSLPYFHAGAIYRELAAQKGISLMAVIAQAQHDLSLDQYVEAGLLQLMQTHKDMVVEGRLTSYQAWKHHIESFRILLTASPAIQAERVSQREKTDYQKTLQEVIERDREDWGRYHRLYGISINEQNQWNSLVINTDTMSIDQVFTTALQAIKSADI